MTNQSDNTLDEIIDNLVVEAVEKAIIEWAGQECPIDASFYNITVVDAKQALTQWRDIAIAEARIDEAKDILANIADLGIEVYFARQRIGRHIVALQSQRDKLRKEKI